MSEIETVAYQARSAVDGRPCGAFSCRQQFPSNPSRWCPNCILAAVLEQPFGPGPLRRYDLVTNYRCGSAIEEMERADDGEWIRYEDIETALATAREEATAAAYETMRRRWDEVFGVQVGDVSGKRDQA